MLNLPRFLAKGLIYSFLFSSPSCQDLNFLPTPSLLPASLGSSLVPPTPTPVLLLLSEALLPLPDPSVLAQDYASPLSLGKTPWSHASLMHPPASYELTVGPPPES